MQVNTYDVGGTQAMQQSALRVHGSRDDDKNFAIDGTTVNWPGGGGGSTMLYYDQGMFEEINYQTSAIPAEVMTGGIYLNMVTKSGSNRWRGDMKTFYANKNWQSDNFDDAIAAGLPGGIPITKLYDFNVAGGGPLVRDKLWINGAYRNWRVDKLTLARNPDGSRADRRQPDLEYVGQGHLAGVRAIRSWPSRGTTTGRSGSTAATRRRTSSRIARRCGRPTRRRRRRSKYTLVAAEGGLRVDVRDHGRRHQLLLPARRRLQTDIRIEDTRPERRVRRGASGTRKRRTIARSSTTCSRTRRRRGAATICQGRQCSSRRWA